MACATLSRRTLEHTVDESEIESRIRKNESGQRAHRISKTVRRTGRGDSAYIFTHMQLPERLYVEVY